MKNEMDKLFQEKLEGHTLPPSDEAWTKVEAKLSKKNSAIAWRIAAAVLMVGALISLLYWSQKNDDKVQQSITAKPTQKENAQHAPVIDNSQKKDEPMQTVVKEKNTALLSSSKKKNASALPSQQVIENKEENNKQLMVEDQKEIVIAEVKEIKPQEKNNMDATSSNAIASTAQKPIKLEFTLDDFASEEKVVATNEVKNTGIKRVWELAKEVKNGEGPVSELREMKNELFALNFKKSKSRTQ